MSEDDIFNKIRQTIYSTIWDLPFDNYHKYYKTGIIQKMSNQEKVEFYFERNKIESKKTSFKKLVLLRPNILDDDDLFHYNEVITKNKKHKAMYLSLFLINNFVHFALMLKNKNAWYVKSMLTINLFLVIISSNSKC